MESEIELKLLVEDGAGKALEKRFIPQLNSECRQQTQQLFNSYFDTKDQWLRQHGLGLRIRGKNGEYEQTIKAKDGSVGGLHQRKEYNVDLPNNELQLTQFPKEIWPNDVQIEQLSEQLEMLFSTHFQRASYHLTLENGTQLELVFDQGEISTEKHQDEICEIEMELLQGSADSLFELANELFDAVPFRLGYKSKAHRGYELWNGEQQDHEDSFSDLQLERELNLSDALSRVLGYQLQQWQMHEQAFIESQKLGHLIGMHQSLQVVGLCLDLFSTQFDCNALRKVRQRSVNVLKDWSWVSSLEVLKVLTSKKGLFRKKLSKSNDVLRELQKQQQALLNEHDPNQILRQKDYVLFQLAVLQLVAMKPWLLAKQQDRSLDINKFAKKTLKQELKYVATTFTFEQTSTKDFYLEHLSKLNYLVKVQRLLGSVAGNKMGAYMQPWLDIQEGTEELKLLDVLQSKLNEIDSDNCEHLLEWCLEKQESLLEIIELTGKSTAGTAGEL